MLFEVVSHYIACTKDIRSEIFQDAVRIDFFLKIKTKFFPMSLNWWYMCVYISLILRVYWPVDFFLSFLHCKWKRLKSLDGIKPQIVGKENGADRKLKAIKTNIENKETAHHFTTHNITQQIHRIETTLTETNNNHVGFESSAWIWMHNISVCATMANSCWYSLAEIIKAVN